MRRLVSWTIAGVVAIGAIATACGGATSTDLLDGPSSGSSGTSSGASSGATSSGSTSSGSTSSGSTSSGSTSSGSTSSGSTSSGSSSSGSTSSSGGVDAGPPAKIKCGALFCTAGTQVCCRKPGIPSPEYSCTAPNGCSGNNALTIPCDDATDCSAAGQPGTVCCGRAASAVDSRIAKIACEKPANCTGDQAAIVCDPALPSSGQCPVTGTTCKSSVVSLPDYNLCLR